MLTGHKSLTICAGNHDIECTINSATNKVFPRVLSLFPHDGVSNIKFRTIKWTSYVS